MPRTYEPIASQTLGSDTATVTFSDIPGTYTDLVVVWQTQHASSDVTNMRFRLNGDTGSNYSTTALTGTGSAAQSTRESSATNIYVTSAAYPQTTTFSVGVLHIMSYANTNVYKTILSAPANASTGVDRIVGLWRSTSAVTSLSFIFGSGSYETGSTFALYGIKAA